MKTIQRLAISMFTLGGIALMTGCPGLIPGTTPSTEPSPTAPADIVGINGRVLFNTAAPTKTITLTFKELASGKFNTIPGAEATSSAGGYYQYSNNVAGTYKAIYKQGDNVTFEAGNNTVGYLQSGDITRAAADKTKAADIDLYWDVNPGVFNTTATKSATASFTFNTKSGNYTYNVKIENGANDIESGWKTISGASASIPLTVPSSTGTYKYQIMYRSASGSESGDGWSGESGGTPNIPFSVQ